MRERKKRFKKEILISIMIFILLMLVFFVKDVKNFIEKEIGDLQEVSIKTNEQVGSSEMMLYASTIEHECSNYLESKYDSTNHWEECSICGTKYNITSHSYEEYWTMGDTCHPSNKCIHTCSCGYSYQSNNTREHTLTTRTSSAYYHITSCTVCKQTIVKETCTKADGSQISCQNLGTCVVCNYEHTQSKHVGKMYENGDINCTMCDMYIGTVSNIEKSIENGEETSTFKWSYDLCTSASGNFDKSTMGFSCTTGGIKEYHTMDKTSSTSIHVTGKTIFPNYESKVSVSSQILNYYASTNEIVLISEIIFLNFNLDQEPPVINSNIVQNDLATSNLWATQKQITISGTENYCSSVRLTLKDSEGNIYLNNATTTVIDNHWSYTFIPNIEADQTGKEFIITATDYFGNSSNQKFTVYATDKQAPIITSSSETSTTWSKTKDFIFTATDGGSGEVSIALNDTNNYVLATKLGTTYSRAYTFTEEIYGSKNYTIYFKDGLGNTSTQTFKVYNIDNTPPTITANSIVNKEIILTGNDKNASNIEGSGIVGYRYLGSSSESVTITDSNSKLTTSNKIALSEFERVKYAYIVAVDKAGNTSEILKIKLPTYQIAVNPNGGNWRGSNEVTGLTGYSNGQAITIENPIRPGYQFTGWKISAGVMENTTYTFELSDAILEAEWNLITPTIENNIEISPYTVSTTSTRRK